MELSHGFARVIRPFYDEEIVPTAVSYEYLSVSRIVTLWWWPRKSAQALIRPGLRIWYCIWCYYRLPSNQRDNVELMYCLGEVTE
ncbi:unnamed protein product [Lasius platythorax]|uniref:Uncharacterized protein n=1 Tax=Lasius platythorax TaxID=488582 RepID=A0AAV2P2E0_9HYME